MSDETPRWFCGCRQEADRAGAAAGWRKRELAYAITGRLPGVPDDVFAQAFAEAAASWSAVCGVRLRPAAAGSRPDIAVGTGTIDGPGQILAWCELPDGSDSPLKMRVDASERWAWEASPRQGYVDLVAVVCHELGHGLGLEHAPQGSPDLMAPVYRAGVRAPQPGDVARIRALYGPAVPQATPVPGPASGPAPTPAGSVVKIIVHFKDGGQVEQTFTNAQEIAIPGFSVRKVG